MIRNLKIIIQMKSILSDILLELMGINMSQIRAHPKCYQASNFRRKMEPLGVFHDGEWDSISRMLFTEDADFTVQCSFPNDHNEVLNFITSSGCWSSDETNANMPAIDESLFFSSDNLNSNLFHFYQESSDSSVFLPNPSQETYYHCDSNHIPITNNTPEALEFCMLEEKNLTSLVSVSPDDLMREVMCLIEEGELDGGHSRAVVVAGKALQPRADDKTSALIHDNPKKRSRVSGDRTRKNVESKKNQKVTPNGNDEEETNAAQNGQTSSCYSSEEDSNASQELNGGATSDSKVSAALNLNGKTRTGRESATDPQSLYARKRREKINERLKILQNLVPNGTKVDISTMLEEAVQYVKFLQLQIKLLSSDDLWMYSPIAYNGMDIGLIQMISPTL